jgi:hypothetical protein
MRRISAKFVPRLLNDDQKAHRVSACRELKQQARDNPNLISNILTGDETWGCVMTLRLSSSRRSRSLQIQCGRKKRIKFAAMTSPGWSFFLDIQGIVHKDFVPPGQTVNSKFYCEVLKWPREGIRRKRPDKWKNINWFLHNDNAPAHTSLVIRQFPTSKSITMSPHAPIRLISSPATFPYSPRWNYGWKGVVLTRLRKSMQNRKRLSTYSCLRTSRDAWNHRKHAEIAVYMPKGTT